MLLPILLMSAACVAGDSPADLRRIDAGEPACKNPRTAPRAVTASERVKVKTYFDGVLLDGPAARWKFDAVRGDIICGSVNAKNRMGAYTGWAPFTFLLGDGTGTVYSEERLWLFATVCKG